MRADTRGRGVPPTVEAYEQVCEAGVDRLISTLIARYTKRMDRIQQYPDQIKFPMLDCLGPITMLDAALRRFGANPGRAPCDYGGEWPDHLLWGVDSAVAAVRLMLCGQFVGAATIARNQMERWLLHRAHNAGLSQLPGESTLEYVARVWSTPDYFSERWFTSEEPAAAFVDDEAGRADEPATDHEHILLTDGSEVCPALLYGYMSELMHGRLLLDGPRWEADGLLEGETPPDELWVVIRVIADTITLCLRQVRLAALTIAAERRDAAVIQYLETPLDRFSSANHDESDPEEAAASSARSAIGEELRSPPMFTLAPLQPNEGLQPSQVAKAQEMSDIFEKALKGRPARRLFRDDEMTTLAFSWHRNRSIKTAQRALDHESTIFGESFKDRSLSGRTVRWLVLGEAASLLSQWHPTPEQAAALAVVGSGIRSTHWLWLEDDDRAMAVLRCVFEQTARCRTWRIKRTKAARLEARASTTPRDWLEAAGWRRLAALNTALGEFAHVKSFTQWDIARELLTQFQRDADPEQARFTARGAAIEFVTMLVAEEVAASAGEVSPAIASRISEAFDHLNLLPDAHLSVEEQFNHIWAIRMTSEPGKSPRPSDVS